MRTEGNLHVTGDITNDGTVDGRDLATDGTKLDAIEASADVTDATNVTAAGALMDSECADVAKVKLTTAAFLLADESKLDAIEAGATASDLTTKGDLAVFTTVDTRLAVGTNDYVLTADSTAAEGFAWKAAAGGGASVLNDLSDCDISTTHATSFYLGTGVGNTNTAGGNTGAGVECMKSLAGAGTSNNTCFGYSANEFGTATLSSTFFGAFAGYYNGGGNYSTGVGHEACRNPSGTHNAAVGYAALKGATNINAGYSTAMGARSQQYVQNGAAYNTTVGYYTALTLTTGTGNTILGSRIDVPAAGSVDQLLIGVDQTTLIHHDGTSHEFKTAFGTAQNTLTDAATIVFDAALSMNYTVVLDGNRTMGTPSNVQAAGTYTFKIVQDATTGSRTITWDALFNFPASTAPTLSTGVNDVDIIQFYCDGTNFYMTSAELNQG